MSQYGVVDLALMLDGFCKSSELKELLDVPVIWKLREKVMAANGQILQHDSAEEMSKASFEQLEKMTKWVSSLPEHDENHKNFKMVMTNILAAREEIAAPFYDKEKIWGEVDSSLRVLFGKEINVDKLIDRGIKHLKIKKETFVQKVSQERGLGV